MCDYSRFSDGCCLFVYAWLSTLIQVNECPVLVPVAAAAVCAKDG